MVLFVRIYFFLYWKSVCIEEKKIFWIFNLLGFLKLVRDDIFFEIFLKFSGSLYNERRCRVV